MAKKKKSKKAEIVEHAPNSVEKDLEIHISSRYPIIYLRSFEEKRSLRMIERVLQRTNKRMFVWSITEGLWDGSNRGNARDFLSPNDQNAPTGNNASQALRDPLRFLSYVLKEPEDMKAAYVALFMHQQIEDKILTRRLKDAHDQLRATGKTLIILSPILKIPKELEKDIVVIDIPLPDKEVFNAIIDSWGRRVKDRKLPNVTVSEDKEVRDKILTAAVGLTNTEFEAVLAKCVATHHKIDEDIVPDVLAEKQAAARRTGSMEFVRTVREKEVGGLDLLKNWMQETKAAFSPEAREFGIDVPKGVLMLGVQGCGKSLCAKTVGDVLGLPILRLDVGALFSGLVGSSEENTRHVLKTAEAIAPCVSGDTMINVSDGSLRSIEDLYFSQDSDKPLFVPAWNEKKLCVEPTKVRAITRREARTWTITAANGFSIRATANHLHYVMRGGMPEWVRTDELVPGDMLAAHTALSDENSDLECHFPEGMREYTKSDGLVHLRRGGGGYRDAIVEKLPSEWNADLAWLFGAVEGDGYISRSFVGFVNTDESLLDEVSRISNEMFGTEPMRYEMDKGDIPDLPGITEDPEFKQCYRQTVGNTLVAEFMKNARDYILSAPKACRASYLAGWIDADGCILEDRIILTVRGGNRKKEQQDLARALLQSIGVTPSKFDNHGNMTISGPRILVLAEQISDFVRLEKKQENLRHVYCSDVGFDRHMGFMCGSIVKEARATSGIPHSKISIPQSQVWRHENGGSAVSERHMREYIDLYNDSNLKSLLDAECRWVKIKSINEFEVEPVYDLVCTGDDTRSFIANGLITHNCVLWLEELDKALNTTGGTMDGGTSSRVFGTIITWMQEKTAPVFIVATANRVINANNEVILPPELLRRGRFDDIFFVDLPTQHEREDILRIHLEKRNRDYKELKIKLPELAARMEGWSGAEVESLVVSSLKTAFLAKRDLSHKLMMDKCGDVIPMSTMMEEEITNLRSWTQGRCRPASSEQAASPAKTPDRLEVPDILPEDIG